MHSISKVLRRGFILSCFIAAGSSPVHAFGPTGTPIPVKVIRVLDGDTIQIEGGKDSVRLSSIDAPESKHGPNKAGQPYSIASGDYLKKRVLNAPGVTLVCMDRDSKYGRDVCELFKDGRSINRELVGAGLAWANTSARGRYLRDSSLIEIQAEARHRRVGLWSQDSERSPAVPPWEWRDVCWKQGICLVLANK